MKPISRSHQQQEQIVAAAAVVLLLLISFSFFYPTLVSKTRRVEDPQTHDEIALKFSGCLLSLQTCFKRWCQKLWSGALCMALLLGTKESRERPKDIFMNPWLHTICKPKSLLPPALITIETRP